MLTCFNSFHHFPVTVLWLSYFVLIIQRCGYVLNWSCFIWNPILSETLDDLSTPYPFLAAWGDSRRINWQVVGGKWMLLPCSMLMPIPASVCWRSTGGRTHRKHADVIHEAIKSYTKIIRNGEQTYMLMFIKFICSCLQNKCKCMSFICIYIHNSNNTYLHEWIIILNHFDGLIDCHQIKLWGYT